MTTLYYRLHDIYMLIGYLFFHYTHRLNSDISWAYVPEYTKQLKFQKCKKPDKNQRRRGRGR